MTCEACRAQHGDDDRAVPCDLGGLDACPYWRTHGASPGALTPEPLVALALELWQRAQILGWPVVERLLPLELTRREAEVVLEVLYMLGQEQQRQAEEARAAQAQWQASQGARQGA